MSNIDGMDISRLKHQLKVLSITNLLLAGIIDEDHARKSRDYRDFLIEEFGTDARVSKDEKPKVFAKVKRSNDQE